jgi:hypothetical protein
MSLPIELYQKIINEIQLNDFVQLREVSQLFNELVSILKFNDLVIIKKEQTLINLPEYIVNIDLRCETIPLEIKLKTHLEIILISSGNVKINLQTLLNFRGLKNLKKLTFIGKNIDDLGVYCLERLDQLTEVDIHNCYHLTTDSLFHLSMMKNLQKLSISDIKTSGFEHFFENTTLTELEYNYYPEAKLDVSIFNRIGNLKTLRLISKYPRGIEQLTNLTSLTLFVYLTDEIMNAVNSLSKLQVLQLEYYEWNNKRLKNRHINISLKNLISLTFKQEEEYEAIDLNLSNTYNLQSLSLQNQLLTQSSMESIILECNELKKISIVYETGRISDLKYLQEMKKLNTLKISSPDYRYYRDEVIKNISRISSLKKLKIDCITDEQLKLLKGIDVSILVQ